MCTHVYMYIYVPASYEFEMTTPYSHRGTPSSLWLGRTLVISMIDSTLGYIIHKRSSARFSNWKAARCWAKVGEPKLTAELLSYPARSRVSNRAGRFRPFAQLLAATRIIPTLKRTRSTTTRLRDCYYVLQRLYYQRAFPL